MDLPKEKNLTADERAWLKERIADENDRARDCASFGEDVAAQWHKDRSAIFSDIRDGFPESDSELLGLFDMGRSASDNCRTAEVPLDKAQSVFAVIAILQDIKDQKPTLYEKIRK